MNEPIMIRLFDAAEDYGMLERWCEGHNRPCVPKVLLPKFGVVAIDGTSLEPLAASFLYMDNSVGVCFMEHSQSKPGLTLARSFGAFSTIVGFMKERALAMGYGFMCIRTIPALARMAERMGFKRDVEGLVSLVGLTKEEN